MKRKAMKKKKLSEAEAPFSLSTCGCAMFCCIIIYSHSHKFYSSIINTYMLKRSKQKSKYKPSSHTNKTSRNVKFISSLRHCAPEYHPIPL